MEKLVTRTLHFAVSSGLGAIRAFLSGCHDCCLGYRLPSPVAFRWDLADTLGGTDMLGVGAVIGWVDL